MVTDAVPITVSRDSISRLWTLTAPLGSLQRPMVNGDTVHVMVAGRLVALDREDGHLRWQSAEPVESASYLSPENLVVAGEYLVIPSSTPQGRYCRDREPIGFTVLSAASGERVCVRDREQVWGFAADASTLVLWRGKRDEDELPARITAVDLQDGSELWHREFRDVGSVLLTGGRVIATTEGRKHRRTRAFDARTGEELWRSEPDAYSGAFLTAAEAGRDGDGQQSFVLAWNRHDDRLQWFSAATGEAAGALTIRPRWQRYRSYEATVADGGRTVWFSAPGARSVHRVRPFESPMLTQTLHTVRPLPYAADPVTVIDGWIYPLRRRGRLSAAKVGGSRRHRWLAPLRLPWGIPLGERFVKTYVTLLEGGNHCYAVRVSRRGQRLLVIRRGRVLWSRPLPGDLVATGDHLLVIGQGDDHDHLWLVDGETGAFTGPSPWPDAA